MRKAQFLNLSIKQLTLLLLIIPSFVFTFKCSSMTTESFCKQVSGCKFEDDECKGTAKISCESDQRCYFVYGQASSTGSGSLSSPYESLDTAILKASDHFNSTIIILDRNETLLNMTKKIDLSNKHITIQAFFDGSKAKIQITSDKSLPNFRLRHEATLNFKNLNLIANGDAEFIESSSGSIVFYQSVVDFETSESYKKITLTNSNIRFLSSKILSSHLVIDADDVGHFESSSKRGVQLKDVQLDANYKTSDTKQPLFKLHSAPLIIEDSNFKGIVRDQMKLSIQDSVFKLSKGTLKVTGSNFSHIRSDLIFTNATTSTDFESNNFENITSGAMLLFANLTNTSPEKNSHFMEDNSFKDIYALQTTIYVSGNSIKMNKLNMKNIYFTSLLPSDYFYENMQGVCAYIQTLYANISYSSFDVVNATCLNYFPVGAPLNEKSPTFNLTHSYFTNTKLDQRGQNAEGLNRLLPGVTWIYFDYHKQTYEIFKTLAPPIEVAIINCIFEDNKIYPEFGGAIGVSLNRLIQLFEIRKNVFHRCKATYGGVIQTTNLDEVIPKEFKGYFIEENIFLETVAKNNGGVLALKTGVSKQVWVQIVNNTFVNVSATIGGALSMKKADGIITDNTFYNNKAKFGGCLYTYSNQAQKFKNNLFALNAAISAGGAYFASNGNVTGFGTANNFVQNSAHKKMTYANPHPVVPYLKVYKVLQDPNFISSLPPYIEGSRELVEYSNYTSLNATYSMDNVSNLIIEDFVPGHTFPLIVKLDLINEDTNSISTVFDQLEVYLDVTQGAILQGKSLKFIEGSLYLYQNISVTGDFDSETTLSIKASNETRSVIDIFRTYGTIDIKIKFAKSCDKGDIFSKLQLACISCPNRTFTLDDPFSDNAACHTCPSEAYCYGKNLLVPQPNYYRESENSSSIVACENPFSCLGGRESGNMSLQGFCGQHFEGPLCSHCVEGFAPQGLSCKECTLDVWFYFTLITKTLFSFIFILFELSHKIKNWNELKDDFESDDPQRKQYLQGMFDSSALSKILASFSQMITFSLALRFKLDPLVRTFYSGIISNVIPLVMTKYTTECILRDHFGVTDENIVYLNLIVEISITFFIGLIFLVFLAHKARKTRNTDEPFSFTESATALVTIMFYLKQPQIIIGALKFFSCRKLGEGQFFLSSRLNVECYTDEHFFWSYYIGGGLIIVFAMLYPLILYRAIAKKFQNRQNLDEWYQNYSKYSFILGGFTQKHYYWEFVILFRKVLMIVVLVVLVWADQFGKSLFFIIIIFLSLFVHIQTRAYENQEIANLETISMISILSFIFMGVYNSQFDDLGINQPNDIDKTIIWLLVGLSAVLAVYFMVKAFMLIWKLNKYTRKLTQTAGKLRRVRQKSEIELDVTFSAKGNGKGNRDTENETL